MDLAKNSVILLEHGDIPDWAYPAVASLLSTLRFVDPATYEHCLRVGNYSQKLARAMGLTSYQQKIAEFSGILHDIGKMGVSGSLIHKPARLTPEEMVVVASHPLLSERMVRPLASNHIFFQQLLPGIRGHHERIDGCGYPDQLQGDEIPLIARLILIVDTLDAMGENRSYRKGQPIEKIYQEMQDCAGTQFDPALVQVFLDSHKFWAKEATAGAQTSELASLLASTLVDLQGSPLVKVA